MQQRMTIIFSANQSILWISTYRNLFPCCQYSQAALFITL